MRDLEFTENEKIEWIYDVVAGIMLCWNFKNTYRKSNENSKYCRYKPINGR